MNISASGTQHMYQYGNQGGNGNENGNGKMKELMQSLPQEDRQALREQLQGMTQTEKKEMVDQLSQIDFANLSSDELTNAIEAFINPKPSSSAEDVLLDTYA